MAFKSLKLMKNRKNKNRKKELQSKQIQQSLKNELLQKLEKDLMVCAVVSYEVPDRLLGDFIDILDDDFGLVYNFSQKTTNVFEFSIKQLF